VITRQNTATYGKGSHQTLIPGLEVSGVIEEIGVEVADKNIGDGFCALIVSPIFRFFRFKQGINFYSE
jgi:NADPH:quinone reductase-like Zn-dependent oxidoreductase